jgi:hypothetical protein
MTGPAETAADQSELARREHPLAESGASKPSWPRAARTQIAHSGASRATVLETRLPSRSAGRRAFSSAFAHARLEVSQQELFKELPHLSPHRTVIATWVLRRTAHRQSAHPAPQ